MKPSLFELLSAFGKSPLIGIVLFGHLCGLAIGMAADFDLNVSRHSRVYLALSIASAIVWALFLVRSVVKAMSSSKNLHRSPFASALNLGSVVPIFLE